MKVPRLCIAIISLTGILPTSQIAQAQSFASVRLQQTAPGQDLSVAGLVVLSGPAYAGSDERRERALPLLDFQWANGWFAGVSNGVGINFSSNPQLRYGVRVTADFGRKESRATALRGMGDIDAKAEGGAFLNVALAEDWQATTSLRYGSGNGGRGLVADVGVLYGTALAPQWRLGASAGLSAVNADYMQTYFGVDASQALRSGYAAYTPRSGLRDARIGASLTYALDQRSALTAAADFNRVLGDAADSPLTRRRDAASAVLVYTYGF
jgi:outer membrane scaffolding protein for murein synthesis (MipA/OmpV family)